jgi:hypothetical protein
MSLDRAAIRRRAQIAASGVNMDLADWNDLCDDALSALWQTIVRINNDFRVKTTTFSIALPTTNSIDLSTTVTDFMAVRTLCRNFGLPDMEYLNKVGPRMGSLGWDRGYRLEGTFLFVEPYERSPGNYRLAYTPQPPFLTADNQVLDFELQQFVAYVVQHMARAANASEESDITSQDRQFSQAESRVIAWASGQRSADSDQVEDVRGMRRGVAYLP